MKKNINPFPSKVAPFCREIEHSQVAAILHLAQRGHRHQVSDSHEPEFNVLSSYVCRSPLIKLFFYVLQVNTWSFLLVVLLNDMFRTSSSFIIVVAFFLVLCILFNNVVSFMIWLCTRWSEHDGFSSIPKLFNPIGGNHDNGLLYRLTFLTSIIVSTHPSCDSGSRQTEQKDCTQSPNKAHDAIDVDK
jgi:hypothetical protein